MTLPRMSKDQVATVIGSVADYAKGIKSDVPALVVTIVSDDMLGFQSREEHIEKLSHQVYLMEQVLLQQGHPEELIQHVKTCFFNTIIAQSEEILLHLNEEQKHSFTEALQQVFGLDIPRTLTEDNVEARMWRDRINSAIGNAGKNR